MIRKKLISLLWPLLAYMLFAFQWAWNYKEIWYSNLPEETSYLHTNAHTMGHYMMYAWIISISFLLFCILGIIWLVKQDPDKVLSYILMALLFISSYFAWLYSVSIRSSKNNSLLIFADLVLFAYSIFRVSRKH